MILTESLKIDLLKTFESQDFFLAEKKAYTLLKEGFSDPWLCNILAVIFAKQKKYSFAAKYFKILTDLFPNDYESFFNLGNLYRDTKDICKSKEYYFLSLKKNPSHLETCFELAKIFFLEKQFDKALNLAERAAIINPNLFEVHDLIGQILFSTGRFNESQKKYEYLLKHSDKKLRDKILVNISSNKIELGLTKQAKNLLRETKSEMGFYNLSLINIKEGNFSKGWKNFDYGILNGSRNVRNIDYLSDKMNLWHPKGNFKSVLVLGEQGIGDEIMYSSLINNLISKKLKVGLLMDRRLKGLLSRSLETHEFIENHKEAVHKGYSSYIPIASLCKFFRNSKDDFDKNIFYFRSNKKILKKLITNYKSQKPRIGISWHTESLSHGKQRNIKLSKFIHLFKNENIDFINLQYGNHDTEINRLSKKLKRNIFLNDSIDNKNDIDGLSAKIEACDIVISIDNSTLHLAGSLNKDTIGLIPKVSDWRWMSNTNLTPWYKSVQLLRSDKNWEKVILEAQNYCIDKFNL